MNGGRYIASWLVVATMFVTPLAPAFGRFECLLGMNKAGPQCPLCHGASSAPANGPSVNGQCCTYVAGKVAPAQAVPASMGRTRPLASSQPIAFACGDGPSWAPRLSGLYRPDDRASPSSPSPFYLSNFLRL